MPNWCYNELTLYIKDSDKDHGIEVLQAFSQADPFQAIRPCPQPLLDTMSGFYGKGTPEQEELERRSAANRKEYGYDNWYDWCCGNWGVKWDVNPTVNTDLKLIGGSWCISVSFDTAWCPPDQLYQYIGYHYPAIELDAYWEEPGCGQKGSFSAHEGMFDSTIEDFTWDDDDIVEETEATPTVGAATVLPLPN